MKHPLRAWLARTNKTGTAFGRAIGCSPQMICDVMAGRSRFGRDLALRVVEQTGGEVTLSDLLTWERAIEVSDQVVRAETAEARA